MSAASWPKKEQEEICMVVNKYGVWSTAQFQAREIRGGLRREMQKTAGSRCKVVRVLLIVLASLRSWASLDLSSIRGSWGRGLVTPKFQSIANN